MLVVVEMRRNAVQFVLVTVSVWFITFYHSSRVPEFGSRCFLEI